MPYVQQKKMNKSGLLFFLTVFLMVITVLISGISIGIKIAIELLIVLVFLFIRRSYIYYQQGAKLYQSGDIQKAMSFFRKAVKSGIGDEQKINIATAFIQKSDADYGISVLEKVISKNQKSTQLANKAKIALSAGLFVNGKTDEAISLLREVEDGGYKDTNWFTNITSFLMAKGDYKSAKKVLNEAAKKDVNASGVLDNLGWYYIVNGDFEKAAEVYENIVDDRQVGFPEAYVHYAQVHAHFNKSAECAECLSWACSKSFLKTCPFTKEYVEKLIEFCAGNSNFCSIFDSNAVLISSGKTFEGLE